MEKSEGQENKTPLNAEENLADISRTSLMAMRREKEALATMLEKQYQQILGQLALIDDLLKIKPGDKKEGGGD